MSTPTEQQLRELFAADAAAAPRDVDLIDGTLRKVRNRRRVRTAGVAGLAGVVVAIGAVVAIGIPGHQPQRSPAAPSGPVARATPHGAEVAPHPAGGGALPWGAVEDCVQSYSPEAVAGRAFAFDGTVTAIGPAATNRPGAELSLAAVTFRVHEWFRGGAGETVTVDMDAPRPAGGVSEPAVPAYAVGTRLLVSGEPRWGGAPLDAALAWGCDFTRYYDPQTAAEWAAATR
jgi:hypothetical protein